MSRFEDKLVVIHTSGTDNPSEILERLPAGKFFRILDETSYPRTSSTGEISNIYEALVLTTKGDAPAWGNYGKFRGCRPYYPGKNFNENAIYWKDQSPEKFVKKFLKAAEFHGKVKFTNRDGYGFIEFPDGFEDLPVLMSALIVLEPEGSKYNYALHQRQNRNDVQESTKLIKELSSNHRRHFKDENKKNMLPNSRN